LQLSGYKRSELIGQNITILMPPAIGAVHKSYVKRYQKTRKSSIMGKSRDVVMIRKDKSELSVKISVGEYTYRNSQRFFASFVDSLNESDSDSSTTTANTTASEVDSYSDDESCDLSSASTSTGSGTRSRK
jgi:PAS domain S-box-containing protein